MGIEFNHTIVKVRDKAEAAEFFGGILGLGPPSTYGPFLCLETANGVSLDFSDTEGEPSPVHYAFLVSEDEFDQIFERLGGRGVDYWADPFLRRPGEINRNDGGRGVYWLDVNGHVLEAITRPYGSV